MVTAPDIPRQRRRSAHANALAGFGAAVVLVVVLARPVSYVITDYWWFASLDKAEVWRTYLLAKVAPAGAAAIVTTVVLWVSLTRARRGSPVVKDPGPWPPSRSAGPGDAADSAAYYARAKIGDRISLLHAMVSGGVGLAVGLHVASWWEQVLLYANRRPFGIADPLFERDVGFYLFELPLYRRLAGLAALLLLLATVLAVAGHWLAGHITFADRPRASRAAKVHLSLLLAALALAQASRHYLSRFELTTSDGLVTGAGYTDVEIRLPALELLTLAALAGAALLIANIWKAGWRLAVVGFSMWGLTFLIAGSIYPALVQRFGVEPAESARELPLLERNIAATHHGLGVTQVRTSTFNVSEELTSADLAANAETIRNIRLWDPEVLRSTYQRLQEIRTFYRFTDVDIDRYLLDGQLTQVVLSARELNSEQLPQSGWVARHLAYTHGHGAVLSPANAVTADGQPDFLVRNLPPQGHPAITRPELYFGEDLPAYALVGTQRAEIDFVASDGTVTETSYDGSGGVDAGSWWRRAVFALRFADINLLITTFANRDTEVIFHRDIVDRVTTLAPFLSPDADPYPAIIDGRIVWILDTYTTTASYPFAQVADTSRLEDSSGLDRQFNYVRNSVKATIDAYDGAVKLYVVEPEDPIIATWQDAVPSLFEPADAVSDELNRHFRYPEDLFRIQTTMWGRYHITDPGEFYTASDAWSIAQDPGTGPIGSAELPDLADQNSATPQVRHGPERRMDPYHLLMRLPGEQLEEFLLLQPLVPFSTDDARKELSAFMVGRSDPEHYGKLEVFVMPRDIQVDGPAIVDARIQQEPTISREISLLNVEGSRVLQGNLLLIPVEESLLYVRPLYLEAEGTQVPELKSVVVVFDDHVVMRDTLQDALTAIFGNAPATREDERPPTAGDETAAAEEARTALAEAARELSLAQEALADGNLVRFAAHYERALAIIDAAQASNEADAANDASEP